MLGFKSVISLFVLFSLVLFFFPFSYLTGQLLEYFFGVTFVLSVVFLCIPLYNF